MGNQNFKDLINENLEFSGHTEKEETEIMLYLRGRMFVDEIEHVYKDKNIDVENYNEGELKLIFKNLIQEYKTIFKLKTEKTEITNYYRIAKKLINKEIIKEIKDYDLNEKEHLEIIEGLEYSFNETTGLSDYQNQLLRRIQENN